MQLSEVKQALQSLVQRLGVLPPHERERAQAEFGEILVCLIQTASRLGIDLVATHRPRILIVEDERIVAEDLQETLNGLGYDAYAIASSAAEALAIARQQRPDIALTDIRIDGRVDGIEVAAQLRREFDTAVIFVTALADDVTLQRARHTEPYAYLIKPVSDSALRTTIELTARRQRQATLTVG
jgi:CheY-like chemotaxis protein